MKSKLDTVLEDLHYTINGGEKIKINEIMNDFLKIKLTKPMVQSSAHKGKVLTHNTYLNEPTIN